MRRFMFLAAAALAAGACAAAAGERRALIVAAAAYGGEILPLAGPPNDALLIRDALLRRGFAPEAVTILMDAGPAAGLGLAPSGPPRRAEIVAALEALAAAAGPGDEVFVMFSGHGAWQPDLDGDEPDGRDEIFLPVDVGVWRPEAGAVENAISDDELGRRLDAVRAKGAFVFAVLDTCHSGTGARGAADGRTHATRYVDPQALGVPPTPAPAWAPAEPPAPAGLVVFAAAQPDELAIEDLLPRGAADARRHGLLAFSLARALNEPGESTYLQLAQRILAGYDRYGQRTPRPLFEGDLSRPAPGAAPAGAATEAARPAFWPAQRVIGARPRRAVVGAGAVHGVTEGDGIVLRGLDGAPLGLEFAIDRIGADRTELVETVPSKTPLADRMLASIEPGAPAAGRLAVFVGRRADAPEALAEAARAAAQAAAAAGLPLRLVGPGEASDIRLVAATDGVEALGGVDPADRNDPSPHARPLRIAPPEGDGAAFREAVRAVLENRRRALAFAALAERLEGAGGALRSELSVERLARPGGPETPCAAPGDGATAELVPAAAIPELDDCDALHVTLANDGDRPVDVTVFYFDVREAFHAMSDRIPAFRIDAGGRVRLAPQQVEAWWWSARRRAAVPNPLGLERLVFAGLARDRAEDLSFLVDLGWLAGGAAARPPALGPAPGFALALERAAAPAGPVTRAAGASLEAGRLASVRWRSVGE